MNNYERIKSMSIDEMAEFLAFQGCENSCVYNAEYDRIYENLDCEGNCKTGIRLWLQEDV